MMKVWWYNKNNLFRQRNCSLENFLGFTLIELLVVVTIVAIVSLLASYSIMGSRLRAQDTARISALKSLAAALELYRTDAFGKIPQANANFAASIGVLAGYKNVFLADGAPLDPDSSRSGDSTYVYCSNQDRTRYVLMAHLDKLESSDNGSLDGQLSSYSSGSCVNEEEVIGNLTGFFSGNVCSHDDGVGRQVYCLGSL